MRYCPECRRVWNAANEYCPADGTGLVLVAGENDPLVGLELGGRYRLKSFLGSGGMGFVYLADQIDLGREVAVKMLFAERTRDPRSLRRFRREAKALAGIDHPGVVRVLEYGDRGGTTPYLVMEKLKGRPLDDVLRSHGQIPPYYAVCIGAQLAEALSAAHGEGVIHRDLKPSNIHLDVRANEVRAQVLDFGLALLAGGAEMGSASDRLTRHGMIFGTPEYMSPEQINGEEADARSDLYSLGVVLYELLAGAPPFVGVTPTAVLGMHLAERPPELQLDGMTDPQLRHELADVVRWALEKERAQRPSDAAELARRLQQLQSRLPNPHPSSNLLGESKARLRMMSTLDEVLPARGSASVPVARASTGSHSLLEVGPITSPSKDSLWGGLAAQRAGDRALESMLAEHGRARRTRRWGLAVLAGAAIGSAAWVGITRSSSGAVRDESVAELRWPEVTAGRLPPLVKMRQNESVRFAAPAAERMPGGEVQQRYEEGLRVLQRKLAARGLRTRDLHAHPRARFLWASQEAAARSGDWSTATRELQTLHQVAARIPTTDLAALRLRNAEKHLGSEGTETQQAAMRALEATLPRDSATAEEVKRFMARVDRLEREGH